MKALVGCSAKEFRPPSEDGKKSMKAVKQSDIQSEAGSRIHSLRGAGMPAPRGKEGRAGVTHVARVLYEGTSVAKVYHFPVVLLSPDSTPVE